MEEGVEEQQLAEALVEQELAQEHVEEEEEGEEEAALVQAQAKKLLSALGPGQASGHASG